MARHEWCLGKVGWFTTIVIFCRACTECSRLDTRDKIRRRQLSQVCRAAIQTAPPQNSCHPVVWAICCHGGLGQFLQNSDFCRADLPAAAAVSWSTHSSRATRSRACAMLNLFRNIWYLTLLGSTSRYFRLLKLLKITYSDKCSFLTLPWDRAKGWQH